MSTDDELDVIYRFVDERLCAGEFDVIDVVLKYLDVERMETVIILAWASITNAARHELGQRADFMCRARFYLSAVEPERVESLLRGFE